MRDVYRMWMHTCACVCARFAVGVYLYAAWYGDVIDEVAEDRIEKECKDKEKESKRLGETRTGT